MTWPHDGLLDARTPTCRFRILWAGLRRRIIRQVNLVGPNSFQARPPKGSSWLL
jgi:hypothetical protein